MARTNVWMSVSDLMTGLMIIFLFIAVSYMSKVSHDVSEYRDTKVVLYDTLKNITNSDKSGTLEFDSTLTLRFVKAQTLFASGDSIPNAEFKKRLSNVMPTYMNILLSLDPNIQKNIKEIRIEGHTDTLGFTDKSKDRYKENLRLSQNRAREVLFYILEIANRKHYTTAQMDLLEHWFTATGFSYSRALDKKGNDLYENHGQSPLDIDRSRRVEIKIVTNEKEVIEKLVKASDKK